MKTEGKGISMSYTIFPKCGSFKGWVVVPEERIRRAKEIIETDDPYHLQDAFCKDKTDRYLSFGVIIESREELAPTLKDGWSIRLRCEAIRKNKLEHVIKHLKLNSD